ncbi:hypothetical protein C8R44DRAFT_848057 [Mycena epipterygia]|nr:hypothetical protein C8R44DRAFT_848057 [Mycena epipterygia]
MGGIVKKSTSEMGNVTAARECPSYHTEQRNPKYKMMYLILCIIPHPPAGIVELCDVAFNLTAHANQLCLGHSVKAHIRKRLLTEALNNTSDSDQLQPGKNRRNHIGEIVRTRAIDGWIISRNVGMRREETIQASIGEALQCLEFPIHRIIRIKDESILFRPSDVFRSAIFMGWWAMSQLVRDSRCYPDSLSADPHNDYMDGMAGMRYQSWPGTRPGGQLSTINLSASVGIVDPPFLAVCNEPRFLFQANRFFLVSGQALPPLLFGDNNQTPESNRLEGAEYDLGSYGDV